jgi:soluble lytic murein transglycosylase-like protein
MKGINVRQGIARLGEYASYKRVALIGAAALLTLGYPTAGYDSPYIQQETRTRSAYSESSQGADKEGDLRRWKLSSLEDITDEGLRLDVRRLNDKNPLLRLWRVYEPYFEEAATRNSVPVNIGAAIACIESRYNPRASSHVGAKGMMQLMPNTAREIGLPKEKVFDPKSSINGGVDYYSGLLEKYGSPMLALVAYNWGQGNLNKLLERGGLSSREVTWSKIKSGLPRETREYVPKVFGAAIKIAKSSEASDL